MDYLVRGPKLPKPGETVMGDLFQEVPGGKRANQVVAAARLEKRVALVARVGEDEKGTVILKRLKDEGIYTKHVTRDKKEQTGVALIMVGEGGKKEILTAPGVNRQFNLNDIHQAATVIQSTRMLITQLEVPLEAVVLSTNTKVLQA